MIDIKLDHKSGTSVLVWSYGDPASHETISYSHGAYIVIRLDDIFRIHLPEECHAVLRPLIGRPEPFRVAVMECVIKHMTVTVLRTMLSEIDHYGKSCEQDGRREQQKKIKDALGL